MQQGYDTQELIEILAAERRACLEGKRLYVSESASSGHPILDHFLQTEGLQKYNAFQGFKAAVHAYQQREKVSGLIWQQVTVRGEQLAFPMVHPQLRALPGDLEQLRSYVAPLVDLWGRMTQGLDLYLAVEQGKNFLPAGEADVAAILPRTHWATLQAWEREDFFEILLQLGWGQPGEAAHWRAWPDSGSEYVHGVLPGHRPIC